MNLIAYLKIFRRRAPSIVMCLLIGLAAALSYNALSDRVYTATTELFVGNQSVESSQQLNYANTFTQARVQSYVRIIGTPGVLQPVIDALKLDMTVRELAPHVSATAPTNRVVIDISTRFGDPDLAAKVANETATTFAAAVENLEKTSQNSVSPVKVTVTQPAYVPSSPTSPDVTRNATLGLLLGLLLGLGQAVVRNMLDTTIKGAADLRDAVDLATIGTVPWDRRAQSEVLALRADPHGGRSEAYRQLRANLQFIDVDNPPKVIAVTSSIPGEGKTTTALNLAASLAEGGARVCLVDADLRRPRVAQSMGLVEQVGLTTVLIGKAELHEVLQNAAQNLAVLTSGEIPPNPSELLLSDHMKQLVDELAARVDYLVIDTAPLLPVVDGAQVAAMSDATILVVRAAKTGRDVVARGVQALAGVGVRPVGVVLNAMPRGRSRSYSYYDYSYGYTSEPGRQARKAAVGAERPLADGGVDATAPTVAARPDDHQVVFHGSRVETP